MIEHPGWKKGGTVMRYNQRLYIRDNGVYHREQMKWFFESVDIVNRTWFITPFTEDIYSPPPSKESNMISRNWIVVSSMDEPSHKPIQHATEQNAIDEAKRLALKNPSDKFFVYELRRAFQVENVKEIEVDDLPF